MIFDAFIADRVTDIDHFCVQVVAGCKDKLESLVVATQALLAPDAELVAKWTFPVDAEKLTLSTCVSIEEILCFFAWLYQFFVVFRSADMVRYKRLFDITFIIKSVKSSEHPHVARIVF